MALFCGRGKSKNIMAEHNFIGKTHKIGLTTGLEIFFYRRLFDILKLK